MGKVTLDFNPFGAPAPPPTAVPKGPTVVPDFHINIKGEPFTDADMVAAGQDWGPATVPGQYSSLPFYADLLACTACSCRPEARQVVPGAGPADARILLIGQNPGEEEDQTGIPFVGSSGVELNGWLQLLGLDRAKVAVTNVVKCHTANNRVPRTTELKTCVNLWLGKEIEALTQLSVLITTGKPAVTGILGKSAPPMTPLMAHHFRITYRDRALSVFPLPHPAFLLRARHLAPMFRETILSQVRLTMQKEASEAYAWSQLTGVTR